MSDKVPTILEDGREIGSITGEEGADEWWYGVGAVNVEKIAAYGEPGQYCDTPWFAVYKEGEIIARVPAGAVRSVEYKD